MVLFLFLIHIYNNAKYARLFLCHVSNAECNLYVGLEDHRLQTMDALSSPVDCLVLSRTVKVSQEDATSCSVQVDFSRYSTLGTRLFIQ